MRLWKQRIAGISKGPSRVASSCEAIAATVRGGAVSSADPRSAPVKVEVEPGWEGRFDAAGVRLRAGYEC